MDLSTDTTLVIDISDALSEQDQVKFTVHTKVRVRSACYRGYRVPIRRR